jgi:hypothetical protein
MCYKRIYIQQLNQTKHRDREENEQQFQVNAKTHKEKKEKKFFFVIFFFCSLKWKKKQIEEQEENTSNNKNVMYYFENVCFFFSLITLLYDLIRMFSVMIHCLLHRFVQVLNVLRLFQYQNQV